MSSSSVTHDPAQPRPNNSNDSLSIPQIIESIPHLIALLSKAKASIPSPQPNTTTTNSDNINNNNGNDVSCNSSSGTSLPPPDNNNNNNSTDVGDSSVPLPTPNNTTTTTTIASGSNSNTTTTTNNGNNQSDATNRNKNNNVANNSNNASTRSSDYENYQHIHNQLERLDRDLKYVKDAFAKLQDLETHVGTQFKTLQQQAQILKGVIYNMTRVTNWSGSSTNLAKPLQANIKAITEMVMKLKLHIPSLHMMNLGSNDGHRSIQTVSGFDAHNLIDEMLKLHENKKFQGCLAFEDFEENYKSLDLRCKLCLLCFSVFPEGAVVKKRLLMYWWVGEGFIDTLVDGDRKAEEVADEILKEFLEKRFIEPVIKKRRLVGFRMHALNRYAVICVASKVGFFNFDSMGNPTADFSSCQRACLMKIEDRYSRQVFKNKTVLVPEKLHTLFNVNDPYPDLDIEWFSRMRNVNVLCLGRWENSSKKHMEDEETRSHIEVDSTEFLKGLKNMKHLKFLSLQGISRINELPDTIWKLSRLQILDLNACHNLEALPSEIVSLHNLTHLDISECYLLDYMPKGLGSFMELQVLKGFVISDLKIKGSGTLDELAGLAKLRKLSIYTSAKDFPTVQELDALRRITTLRKLTIAWGGRSHAKSGPIQTASRRGKLTRSIAFKQENSGAITPDLPKDLEKLDLQCYPETKAPSWLMPGKLECLKKLYIRGGNLHNLGQAQGADDKWKVKILRLKFLQELRMDWRQFQNAFPYLIYVEKVKCPKLTFFPCDESGVWLNRKMLSEQLLKELEFTWSFLATRST